MTLIVALAGALWLGILTSISPCPLATNIAAVSFIARRCERARNSLLSGLLYALGRTFAYVVIGTLAVLGVLNLPIVSQFLQEYSGKLLGPLLILVGMVLVDLIRFRVPGGSSLARLEEKAATWGHPGAFVLGAIFALAFCPVSAAL
ncbi:MAG: sulfite exporter TauE/SafE family protein, partial [bacterium]